MLAFLFVILVIPFGLSLGANPGWIADRIPKLLPFLEPISKLFGTIFEKAEKLLIVVIVILGIFTLFVIGVSAVSFTIPLENDGIPNFTGCMDLKTKDLAADKVESKAAYFAECCEKVGGDVLTEGALCSR